LVAMRDENLLFEKKNQALRAPEDTLALSSKKEEEVVMDFLAKLREVDPNAFREQNLPQDQPMWSKLSKAEHERSLQSMPDNLRQLQIQRDSLLLQKNT